MRCCSSRCAGITSLGLLEGTDAARLVSDPVEVFGDPAGGVAFGRGPLRQRHPNSVVSDGSTTFDRTPRGAQLLVEERHCSKGSMGSLCAFCEFLSCCFVIRISHIVGFDEVVAESQAVEARLSMTAWICLRVIALSSDHRHTGVA